MARPCRICQTAALAKLVSKLVDQGVADRAIAARTGVSKSAVARHRAAHIVKPLQDKLSILTRDKEERQKRQAVAKVAASPEAPTLEQLIENWFGVRAAAENLHDVQEGLKRTFVRAEGAGMYGVIAPIANAQVRTIESGLRFSGHPNYTGPRGAGEAAGHAAKFAVQIVFQGADRTETITVGGPARAGAMIDSIADDVDHEPDADQDDGG